MMRRFRSCLLPTNHAQPLQDGRDLFPPLFALRGRKKPKSADESCARPLVLLEMVGHVFERGFHNRPRLWQDPMIDEPEICLDRPKKI